jgi:ABC-type dipeptide/oligopeptide/nickel transport system permease subunit
MKVRISFVLLLLLLASAALTLRFMPFDYASQDRTATMAAASAEHPAGTDALGRDRVVRVSAALLIGIGGAVGAAGITTMIAAAFGLLAAFSPAPAAALLLFVSDAFLSVPWLFLLMIARSLLPLTASPLATAVTTFLVLAFLGWPAFGRAVYGGTRSMLSAEWMIQGRATGLRDGQLIRLHLLPHLSSFLVPQFLICVPAFIVAEANLGALGLGVGEPMPSWGGMLLELENSAMIARSHWVYLPIALLVVVLLILESFTTEVKSHA